MDIPNGIAFPDLVLALTVKTNGLANRYGDWAGKPPGSEPPADKLVNSSNSCADSLAGLAKAMDNLKTAREEFELRWPSRA